MFCTKCGKRLYDGDSFCAHCGAKVRDELLFKKEIKSTPRTTRYDEVVFNPPFKGKQKEELKALKQRLNVTVQSQAEKESVLIGT